MLTQAALAASVFFGYVALDLAWAFYMMEVTAGRRHHAALWSMAITFIAGFTVIQYVNNNWLLIPACIGCYVGTWVAIAAKGDAK